MTLIDYRLRHALYKSDVDSQEAHRQHPFICVWDDHEFANDSYANGAENHNTEFGEGDWQARKRNAIRAYREYMPTRDRSLGDERIYRSFKFGTLADCMMLDTRIHGRVKQVAPKSKSEIRTDDLEIVDAKRTLLGFDQERWLERELSASTRRGTQWRLLGQQVMMAQLSVTKGVTLRNADQWDGYAPARERLFQHLRDNRVGNNVVMSGDIHSSWCNDLASKPWDESAYDPVSGKGSLGVEFITPAVSSPSPITDPAEAVNRARLLPTVSPHVKYVDFIQRGYLVMDITHQKAQGEIYHVPTVDRREHGETLGATFVAEAGRNGLQSASGATTPRSGPDPAT